MNSKKFLLLGAIIAVLMYFYKDKPKTQISCVNCPLYSSSNATPCMNCPVKQGIA